MVDLDFIEFFVKLFNFKGRVLTCDLVFAHLLGYHHPDEINGRFIKELMPSLKISRHNHALPKVRWQQSLKFHFSLNRVINNVVQDLNVVLTFFQMLRLQKLCGKNRSGASVPLCIKLQGAVVCGKLHRQDSKPERCEQQHHKEAISGKMCYS